jgi:hypothetical protein
MVHAKPERIGSVLLIILGTLLFCSFGLSLLVVLLSRRNDATSAQFAVILTLTGSGMAALGLWLYKSQKSRYAVVVRTASGEVKALVTRDGETVEQIVAALSQAFADRG